MITWMQKHNRYLVWTIWIATIAFIGAGFVGWGSYSYGSKASAVGKVGDVEIPREKLDFTYRNLYERYREIYKGAFDEAKAKELGLLKQSFASLASQAQLLNLAEQYGIVVSEKELADDIAGMQAFQENGTFSKTVYKTYLQNRGLKSSTFESILRDELKVKKTIDLLESKALPPEHAAVASALSVADKIAYAVLSPADMNVSVSDSEARKVWEESKNDYMSPKRYRLAIHWTDTKTIPVTEKEVQDFYDKNSFNYISQDGKQFTLDKVKDLVTQDLRIKKGKKQALLDYIALKKGKRSSEENATLSLNDPLLSAALWSEVEQRDAGTLLKPKPVGSRYATVKILQAVAPAPLPFAKAKSSVIRRIQRERSAAMLEKKAQETLNNIDKASLQTSEYLSLSKPTPIPPLSQQESLQFLEKLFTSSGKKGIIRLSNRVVVYKVVDQTVGSSDENLTKNVQNETNLIKRRVFENTLFKRLNTQFPVKAYVKGL